MQAMDGPPNRRSAGGESRLPPRMASPETTRARRSRRNRPVAERGHCDFVASSRRRSVADNRRHARPRSDTSSCPSMGVTHHADARAQSPEFLAGRRSSSRTSRGGGCAQARAARRLISTGVQAEREGTLDFKGTACRGLREGRLLPRTVRALAATNPRKASRRGAARIEHPEECERCASTRGGPRAVEEVLRWSTPVRASRRTMVKDAELAGRRLREGTRADALLPGMG